LPHEVEEIYDFLQSLADTPRPEGVQAIALAEAAEGIAYLYDDLLWSIFYNIFEAIYLVRVVAIFKKISLN
jgi:hypothetical protein